MSGWALSRRLPKAFVLLEASWLRALDQSHEPGWRWESQLPASRLCVFSLLRLTLWHCDIVTCIYNHLHAVNGGLCRFTSASHLLHACILRLTALTRQSLASNLMLKAARTIALQHLETGNCPKRRGNHQTPLTLRGCIKFMPQSRSVDVQGLHKSEAFRPAEGGWRKDGKNTKVQVEEGAIERFQNRLSHDYINMYLNVSNDWKVRRNLQSEMGKDVFLLSFCGRQEEGNKLHQNLGWPKHSWSCTEVLTRTGYRSCPIIATRIKKDDRFTLQSKLWIRSNDSNRSCPGRRLNRVGTPAWTSCFTKLKKIVPLLQDATSISRMNKKRQLNESNVPDGQRCDTWPSGGAWSPKCTKTCTLRIYEKSAQMEVPLWSATSKTHKLHV